MKLLITKNYNTVIKIIAWSLYDWAISPFFSIVTTFVFAAYFERNIVKNTIVGTHLWGNAVAIAGLTIALVSPFAGAIADYGGHRKIWLFCFTVLGMISAALLWFAYPHTDYILLTLFLVIVGSASFELATVFYNALLPSITPTNYLGRISGWGWGSGYAGGVTALILVLTVLIYPQPKWLDGQTYAYVRICGPLTAVWVFIFALPLFLFVPDIKGKLTAKVAIQKGLIGIFETLRKLPKQPSILLFFVGRMFYIDGLNTLFAFGGIYASGTFDMPISEVVLFGIVLNITAGIGAIAFAWLDDWIGAKPTILIALISLIVFGIFILLIHSKALFWLIAPILGFFVGPTQAASRSLMVRLAKPEQITEMFGFFAFSGKVTAFFGPWILGQITLIMNSQRFGMATIFLFLFIGGCLLLFVEEPIHERVISPKIKMQFLKSR